MLRICAVIPARAGSKGVPNKNLRLIADRPLVYYAIRNALDTELITDVIVSTDSELVAGIARQLGARVHWRDAALAGDSIALDEVIYDAVKNAAYDYVVTLQPTSPTLLPETLSVALTRAIAEDLDTLISVINHPHLAWKTHEGQLVPAYEKRLNRQYLPPYYLETGAFVISKGSAVKVNTRFGPKLSVYELSEAEAIDVDNFYDLLVVNEIMNRQEVAIYVNGNTTRGIGHVYRALELADEFYVKPDIYYDQNQTDPKVFGVTTHRLIPVDGIGDLFDRIGRKPYTLFINDILQTTVDYMIALRRALPKAKIVNFEDDGEGKERADLVFNALYSGDHLAHEYAGEKYYISSKLFLFYEPIAIKACVKRCFISFGGADPQNYTDRLLDIVSREEYKQYDFVVALGRAKQNIEELLRFNVAPNIEVLYDVANMPALMSTCDVAITSRGRTGYELALLGIPSLAMAQNQREEKHGFVSDENGFAYLGLNPDDAAIEQALQQYLALTQAERQRLQDVLLSHDLRNGRKRVMSLIKGL